MTPLERLHRRFAYNNWANREVARSLAAVEQLPEYPVKVLAHIAGAEQLWLARLTSGEQVMPVWPPLELADCEAALGTVAEAWEGYLASLDASGLERPVAYVNTKGVSWTNTVEDILDHVITHSAYHRGQIASAVREAGDTPAYTDLIHAIRNHLAD